MAYIVTVEFTIAAEHLSSFKQAMCANAKDSLALEPGCVVFDVCQGESQQNVIFLYEVYTDKQAFALHLQSQHFKQFDMRIKDWVVDKKVQTWVKEGDVSHEA